MDAPSNDMAILMPEVVPREPSIKAAEHPSPFQDAAPLLHPPTKSKHFDANAKAKRQLGMRSWLKVDCSGEIQFVMLDKFRVVHEYGVQLRDLRILDPNLATTYPSAILCREKALIVNIEHIRLIITPEAVMVRNAEDAPVKQFVETLRQKLAQPANAWAASQPNLALNVNGTGVDHVFPKEDISKGPLPPPAADGAPPRMFATPQFPFELRALEVCLEQVAQMLDTESSQLEASAHHALEHLTKKVTAHNLERVRKIKTRMVRLSTKVETIREVLEKLLDDDKDMLSMNLTAKSAIAGTSPHAPFEVAQSVSSSASSDSDFEEDEIAKVEMLLEPYFMQVDNTYNRLQGVKEYIDDTEDLINIKLDQHRNRLIGIDLLFTAAMFALSLITAVTGIFGMNLNSKTQESYSMFELVSVGTSGLAVVLFGLFVFVSYRKKLLNFW